MTFVYLMQNQKTLNQEIIAHHVEHLKELDRQGKLVLCGPFSDYPGGMVILNAVDLEEADRIAQADPFIATGYKTYELRTIELADASNHYLL